MRAPPIHRGTCRCTPRRRAAPSRVAKILLDAGADIHATAGAQGRDTALRLAEIQGLEEIATILRERERAAN